MLGQDIEVYNRQNRLDFIFAGDVAEGLVRLADSPNAEGTVNLGFGVARSIEEVLDLLVEHVPTAKQRMQDLGTTEPFEASCADLTRLTQLTGWNPSVDLETGIKIVTEFEGSRGGKIAYES